MSHAFGPRSTAGTGETAIDALARETDTTPDLVRMLFQQESARLAASATITQYIDLLAARNVRHQLRTLDHP